MREYHVAWETINGCIYRRMDAPATAAMRRACTVRRLQAGQAYRFKPGFRPWNKGLKGIHLSPASEFKAGCLRGQAARNYRPLGTIVTRVEDPVTSRGSQRPRRRWIKIREDGRSCDRWIPLARYIWQNLRGPISARMFVAHWDGNSMNDDPSNLVLVSHSSAMRLQFSRDPKLLKLSRSRCREAVLRRHAMNRQIKQEIRAIRMQAPATWECPACGHEEQQTTKPDKCPKCGAYTFKRIG